MKSKEEIAEIIFDQFRKSNCRENHIVMMRIFYLSVIPKLNPKEQDLFYGVANELVSQGYITYEDGSSGPECFRLTEKGYDRIYDDSYFVTHESQSIIYQNKQSVNQVENVKLPVVVILTAILEEYKAVRNHLSDIEDADQNDTNYEVGVFKFNEKNIAQVFIRECGAKNTTASQETERAISNFHPECMLFVGIAGSRKHNDFAIGDVIFPEKIYSYEGGKSEQDSFKSRPDSTPSTFALMEIAKKERRKDDWKQLITNDNRKGVKADIGVIASGEQIIEHYNSEVGKILLNHFNDTSAVEMEGFGFARAASRQGQKHAHMHIGVIRGISDLISQSTDDNHHILLDTRPADAKNFASDTASAFAFWLILKLYEVVDKS